MVAVVAAAAGIVAGLLAGPVAGVAAAVYAAVTAGFWQRHREARARLRARDRALDALAALAADLRAGLPPQVARSAVATLIDAVPLVRDRVAAAAHVADRTGAPLADLLDRLEVDLYPCFCTPGPVRVASPSRYCSSSPAWVGRAG